MSLSGRGWAIRPGPPIGPSRRPTTVVVNPRGKEFNIGYTQYPDFPRATLWIVEVKELHARFLVIRVPPVASAAVAMPVLYLDENEKPTLAGAVVQRFEFTVHPDDAPGANPRVICDGEHLLRDMLFEDSDGDGIPELKEDAIWKDGGTVTYYRFTKAKRFVPLWREKWRRGDNGFELVSRKKVLNP